MTRKFLAEFIGAFSLTFVGGGAIIATSGENLVIIALAQWHHSCCHDCSHDAYQWSTI